MCSFLGRHTLIFVAVGTVAVRTGAIALADTTAPVRSPGKLRLKLCGWAIHPARLHPCKERNEQSKRKQKGVSIFHTVARCSIILLGLGWQPGPLPDVAMMRGSVPQIQPKS